jgi:hypothetical protein
VTRIGYKSWICTTKVMYVETAVALASNHGALAKIRNGLRERMANSHLCDGKVFTHALEQTYREKWQLYVEKQNAKRGTPNGPKEQPKEEEVTMSGDMKAVRAGEDGPPSASTAFRAPTPTEYASTPHNHSTNSGGSY